MKDKIVKILRENPQGLKAKDIARHFSVADKKAVNQVLYANPNIFTINSNYEWTLKSQAPIPKNKTSSPKSTAEIKALFKGVEISATDILTLKRLSANEVKTISQRFGLLSLFIHTNWDDNRYFNVILTTALIKPEKEFTQILEKTKRIEQLHPMNNCYLWDAVICAPDFEAVCSHAQELKRKIGYVAPHQWLEIVLMPAVKYKAFINRVIEIKSTSNNLYSGDLVTFALSNDYERIYNHLNSLKKLKESGKFPELTEWNYSWKRLINANDQQFEIYLQHIRKIYKYETQLLGEIVLPDDKYQSRFLDVVLLGDTEFKNLCHNLFCYTHLPTTEPLSNNDWLKFFLQTKREFERSWMRTQILNDAVAQKQIALLSIVEWKRFMEATSQKVFEYKLQQQKEQYQAFLEEQELRRRAREQLSEEWKRIKDKPIKQCFGDCGACKRDKCVLEEG